jgi:hypothetical protein
MPNGMRNLTLAVPAVSAVVSSEHVTIHVAALLAVAPVGPVAPVFVAVPIGPV